MKKNSFILKNLDCASSANKIQVESSKNPNLKNVVVNFNTLKLTYETENVSKEEVKNIVADVEPEVEMIEISDNVGNENNKTTFQVIRLVVGVLIAFIGFYGTLPIAISKICIISIIKQKIAQNFKKKSKILLKKKILLMNTIT